ncbi:MAG TPA: hypothetical protein VFU72_00605 [Nitrolancea sp.]|nr:hypothetical protein [Nitrolancea sp.]
MFRLATFAYWLDDQQRARELSEGLLANSRRTGNDEGIGKALYLLASQPPWREPSAAISLLEEATHCFQRAGNPHWAVLCQGSLAKRAMELGQLERATWLLEQAYATCRRLEHDWGAALALEWLGRVAVATGDNARAIMHLRESLRLLAEEQDTMQFALTLIDITIPLARSGDTRQAVYLLASSEARLLEMGVTLMSWQQAIHQEVTTQARAVLGEPAMQEIWEAGRQMSLADIAAQLGTDDPLTLVPKDPS